MLSQSPICSLRPLSLARAPLAGRGLCSSLLVLLALGTVQAGAATILVPGSTSCTLDDAIKAANTDATQGNCTAGSGDDTIELTANVTLSANTSNTVTSNIILDGKNLYFISGRTGLSTPTYRILKVDFGGNLTVKNIILQYGKGADGGGAIDNDGTLTVDNSTLNNNKSSQTGTFAGAIYNRANRTATVKNSTIRNNTATSGAAIYNGEGATLTVENCTIHSNQASDLGGVIYNGSGTVNVTYSTIYNNQNVLDTGLGGGIFLENGGTANLYGNIISGNTVSSGGTFLGIEVLNNDVLPSTLSTINSNYNLIGNNQITTEQALYGYTPAANDITSTSDGTKPTAIANILKTPNFNGGNTITAALVAGSPAVDAIPTGVTPTCTTGGTEGTTKDQRGYSRANGNSGVNSSNCGNSPPNPTAYGNQKCDIGAYEFIGKNVCSLRTFTITARSSDMNAKNSTVDCAPTVGGTVGTYYITVETKNTSSTNLYNFIHKVRRINPSTAGQHDNYLMNTTDGVPKGVGAVISSSATFNPGEKITQTYNVGLCSKSSFAFFADTFADPSVKGVLSASDIDETTQSEPSGQLRLYVDVESNQVYRIDSDDSSNKVYVTDSDGNQLPVYAIDSVNSTVPDDSNSQVYLKNGGDGTQLPIISTIGQPKTIRTIK